MNIGKKVLMAIAAMIVISIVAVTVSAICTPTVCEKDCSTKVEQCDVEAVMALSQVPDGAQVVAVGDDVYIDMTGNDNRIGAGDIRLTQTCCGEPNTKVMPHDNEEIESVFNPLAQDIFTYMDSNTNGIYDVGDAIYLDVDNDGETSVYDIRLTDSPPFDVLNPDGSIAIHAGEYGYAWSRVLQADDDFGEVLKHIGEGIIDTGEGTLQALGGTIDGDCSGDWTCPDKLYLNQPTDLPQFDNFVTIGDLRLYMPNASHVMPLAMGECFESCGTRVRQCAKDAVYALRVDDGVQTWGYVDEADDNIFTPGDHNEAGYIDMNHDGTVSVGDVRLTSAVSLLYGPNTKVADCDWDINQVLEIPAVFTSDPQTVFRYVEVDEEPGYSLGDPVYMDVDNSSDVSKYDIRITQSPVCDILDASGNVDVAAGEWGASWSIVELTDFDAINDMVLAPLPDRNGGAATVDNLLGFIDSDCNLCWSCTDKLYLQQLVGATNYDLFVTIGDIRLYVPPAAMGPGPGEPCWEPCGTKVQQCDVDLVYALMSMPAVAQVRYVEEDSNAGYSHENAILGDGVYIDMDGNGIVSAGDIRLSNVCGQYDANTKVGTDVQENQDLWDPFADEPADQVLYADIDGLAGYTLGDPLYLDMTGNGLTLGDIRITASPVYVDSDYGATGSIGAAWTRIVPGDADLLWAAQGITIAPVSNGALESITKAFDSDCTQSWTCPDKLYLQQTKYFDDSGMGFDDFVTIGDERLYIPNSTGPTNPDDWNDWDDDCVIEDSEISNAVYYWKTLVQVNGHTVTDSEMSLFVYQWKTGDVC